MGDSKVVGTPEEEWVLDWISRNNSHSNTDLTHQESATSEATIMPWALSSRHASQLWSRTQKLEILPLSTLEAAERMLEHFSRKPHTFIILLASRKTQKEAKGWPLLYFCFPNLKQVYPIDSLEPWPTRAPEKLKEGGTEVMESDDP